MDSQDDKKEYSIDTLGLHGRTRNTLHRNGIHTISQLTECVLSNKIFSIKSISTEQIKIVMEALELIKSSEGLEKKVYEPEGVDKHRRKQKIVQKKKTNRAHHKHGRIMTKEEVMDELLTPLNELERKLGLFIPNQLQQFYLEPGYSTFKVIPKKDQFIELIDYALSLDPSVLKYASKKLITMEMCKKAVENDGKVLRGVPEMYRTTEICMVAVAQDGRALQYVPRDLISDEMVKEAVSQSFSLDSMMYEDYPIAFVPDESMSSEIVRITIDASPGSIKNIPLKYRTKEIIEKALRYDGRLIDYVPQNMLSDNLIRNAIEQNPEALRYVPVEMRKQDFCIKAFYANPLIIEIIPEEFRTKEMYSMFMRSSQEKGLHLSITSLCRKYRNDKEMIEKYAELIGASSLLNQIDKLDINERLLFEKETIEYLKGMAEKVTETLKDLYVVTCFDDSNIKNEIISGAIVESQGGIMCIDNQSQDQNEKIFYISDIHLEHQIKPFLDNGQIRSYYDIRSFIRRGIKKALLLGAITETTGKTLFICGDVSHTPELWEMFYEELNKLWAGNIISVLGNHEFMHLESDDSMEQRHIDAVLRYKEMTASTSTWLSNPVLLENELFIFYKNQLKRIIDMDTILEAKEEDLRSVLNKSSLIVLGGSGFNYDDSQIIRGYYGPAFDAEEEIELSDGFFQVYRKVARCAYDKRVMVITHTPPESWMLCRGAFVEGACYLHDWVYIHGHTHSNVSYRSENGAWVIGDNQIGYKPKEWCFKALDVLNWYDEFADWDDGIYEITSEQYLDFNRGRGIKSNGCNYDGKIYALKNNSIYMFVLESERSLCILDGGLRKRLEYDIDYYYENLVEYAENMKMLLSPYRENLKKIATDVKAFGGIGRIHGCIVDITGLSHIFLNPNDGTVSFYWALSMDDRIGYPSIESLLSKHEEVLYQNYKLIESKNQLMILSNINDKTAISRPKYESGRGGYRASFIIKKIQYLYENNVIRMWNDEVLNLSERHSIESAVKLIDHIIT